MNTKIMRKRNSGEDISNVSKLVVIDALLRPLENSGAGEADSHHLRHRSNLELEIAVMGWIPV